MATWTGDLKLIDGLRSSYAPDTALSAVAEQLLLDAGRIEEPYARYGIQATAANTNIATYRAIAKRFPGIEPNWILGDLIASTPGEKGKWVRYGQDAETVRTGARACAARTRGPKDADSCCARPRQKSAGLRFGGGAHRASLDGERRRL